ncbi:MAG: hypothetical protein ABIB11_00360 [Candidatus Omnitrophota bacterium]
MPKVKVTLEMVLEWRNTVQELKNTIRSKNRGFPNAKRQIYLLIAQKYNVDVQTVYHYMNQKVRNRAYDRNYDLKYKRVVRHIDSYFPQIFNSNPDLPLSEISSRINSLSDIHLKENTLETLLNKYNGNPRGSPLIKAESGNYQLNPSFYNN